MGVSYTDNIITQRYNKSNKYILKATIARWTFATADLYCSNQLWQKDKRQYKKTRLSKSKTSNKIICAYAIAID